MARPVRQCLGTVPDGLGKPEPPDPDSSERRIVRGGCWVNDSLLTLRTTLRDGPYPYGYNHYGFRCVRLG